MIVLNENDWAVEMIQSRSLGRKPYETLCRVAKYYIDKKGYSKKEVRKTMDDFCSCVIRQPHYQNGQIQLITL